MHDEVWRWVQGRATQETVSVLEIGGMNVNGTIRDHFPNADPYVALDLYDGEGVDVVADATCWIPDREYDVVVTTGMLEHLEGWRDVLDTAYEALRSGGQLLCTAAGPGWKIHGQHGASGLADGEWYENIDPQEMVLALAGWEDVDISLGGCYNADLYVIARKP